MKRDLDHAYPETPERYRNTLDDTLDRLEEISMKRRHKAIMSLAAAGVIILLMGTAALASLQRLQMLTPLSAERDSASYLATAENDKLRVTIREGTYDGKFIKLVVGVEPVEPEKYAVAHKKQPFLPEGRELIMLSKIILEDDRGMDIGADCQLEYGISAGNARLYGVTGFLSYNTPETVPLTCTVVSESVKLSAQFTLKVDEVIRTVRYEPMTEETDYTIHNVEVNYTELGIYMEMRYEGYIAVIGDDGYHIPDGSYYWFRDKEHFHADMECSALVGEGDLKQVWSQRLSWLIEESKSPCPTCFEGVPEGAPEMRRIVFYPFDEHGNRLYYTGMGYGPVNREAGDGMHFEWMRLERYFEMPDVFYLQPTLGEKAAGYERIELRAIKEQS